MSKKIQHGELDLLPYTIQDGIPSMSDSYIMGMYDEMERNHQLRWVFFSGGVSNREEWLAFIKSRVSPFWMIVDWADIRPDGYPKIYGSVLLTDCKPKCAHIHLHFFRCNDKARYAAKFCSEIKKIMKYDILFGFTPVTNIRINKFTKTVEGWEEVAIVPKAAWDELNHKSVDAALYCFKGL